MENIPARLDSSLEIFEMIAKQPDLPLKVKDAVLMVHLDFRFLKLFSMLALKCAEGTGRDANLDFITISIGALVEALEGEEGTDEEWEDDFTSVDVLQIFGIRIKIKEICDDLWDCSFQAISGNSDEITKFLDLILWNLRDLVNWKYDLCAPQKRQIRVLQDKLCLIGNIFDFSKQRCPDQQKLEEFWSFMQGVMNSAACLSVLFWTDGKDENQAAKLDSMLADILKNIKPYNPMAIEMYLGVLLPSKSSKFGKFMISEFVMGLWDLLLEDLASPIKNRSKVFQDGLIFCTTFLMNRPENPEREVGDVLLSRIDDIISYVVSFICSCYMDDDVEMSIAPEVEESLSGLQVEIDEVLAEVREIYVHNPKFSGSHFPVTNEIGFFDCLLGNLKDMMMSKASRIQFAMGKILFIQEELVSIRDFLKEVELLKDEQQEVKDLWDRIMNVAYHADHIINSCLIVDSPIWYDIISLSNVTEEIEVIKNEVQKVTDLEMYKIRKPYDEYHSAGPLIPRRQANNTSRVEEVVVGFKDEMETIIDRLTRGTSQLDIISIVGMPGQGKTTLAKMVYNDLAVKYHFNKCSWCYVSQMYETKELLFDILSDVSDPDIRSSDPKLTEDELAERLWKSLKGRRFLIVMDDVWDIGAWDGIKRSLPDDGIGSRIVFTSRIHNLVSQAKPNCSPHCIRLLNDAESWELLQERVFHNGCPSELSEIGKEIATLCKGLPLAVVLVAGILAKMEKGLDCWEEMIETMGSNIKDLVELSYKHLPKCLRACFLYFGAFHEAQVIRVRKLIKLWTAEGFVIPTNDVKSSDDIAREYLMDLIDRSLVTVAARSSKGEIKACRVHDLLLDFCLTKAQEERFLHKVHGSDISDDSPAKIYAHYRLSIYKWKQFLASRPAAGSYVHSVVVSLPGIQVEWGRSLSLTSFFLGFKFLNVLDMECIYIDDFFPQHITLMIHLRYLAIWCCTNYLPSAISDLWKLETLIVKSARLYSIPLPDAIWSMKTLRHIDIPTMTFRLDKNDDESCILHNISTFSAPTLTSEKDTEELLRRLPGLRKLKCNFMEIKLASEDFIRFPSLICLSQLESLAVFNGGDMLFGENFDQFPSFDLPTTLRKLTLEIFCLTESAISAIGKLPNLQVLKLRQSGFRSLRWDLEDDEFLKLKFLELSKVQLQEWNDCSGEPFPRLHRLVLKNCEILEEIPLSFGDIQTLKRMDVLWCPKASSSARRIQDEQRDMGNDGLEFYILDD